MDSKVSESPSNWVMTRPRSRYHLYALLLIPCLLLGSLAGHRRYYYAISNPDIDFSASSCAQVDALYPQSSKNTDLWEEFGQMLGTDEFKELAIGKLSGLIQIPSESYDNMPPPGQDPRWETMGLVHDYLAAEFPLINKTLSLAKVNTYGLIYEWTGTNSSLKPYILAAHQDVVPVNPETVSTWTHPPYSGFFDGENIWGRGASDDKASLTAIMLTLETLIEKEWTPERTIVLAFGFDEEASGIYGAKYLGKALEETYGRDAFAFIVDEGGGFKDVYGTIFATPGVAEKGHADIKLEVTSPGGHSSVPPVHTTIGYLASLITEFEKNPYPVELARDTVPYDNLVCMAAHSRDIPHSLKRAIFRSGHSNAALHRVEKDFVLQDKFYSSLVGTTQAVDIVSGGVKSNALPESAFAIINHRINTLSSVNETAARDTQTITSLAQSLGLTLKAFGEDVIPESFYTTSHCSSQSSSASSSKGHIELSLAFNHELEPAPRTPTSGKESKPWDFLSGTIKATYYSHRAQGIKAETTVTEGDDVNSDVEEKKIIVSPGMSTGNTDTKYYWNLTRHIFRYNHKKRGVWKRDCNRRAYDIPLDHYLEIIRFFTTLIMNADEAEVF
ncbi:carboxypeptidase S [Gymnopus androsaceus JB14]|uniref:Carboxypeptidase S n=1 Tax=Gymnopus androsaceus JB14 TaxID=1447944 RepID=A0A6A4GXT1_9AGAR|nr:carboxypeptidase S [Gymnopus androsaceus JB14]